MSMPGGDVVRLSSLVLQLPGYSLLRNEQRKERCKQRGQKIFDFGLGDPLEPTPAFIGKALAEAIPDISQYPSAVGGLPLRKAFCQWMLRRCGVDLHPNLQVISSNGSKEAIFHVPFLLANPLSPRRVIVYPDPGFPVYKSGTMLAGLVGYPVTLDPLKQYVFDPDQIPPELLPEVAAVWVSYPHNPTGACISLEQMHRIYQWALRHHIVLLSDECYLDMFFPGSQPPHSFLEVSKANQFKNVLAFHTLSKRSGMTGYRSGCVAGDSELIGAYAKLRPHIGLGTPEFVQAAATAAWQDDVHVQERSHVFAHKRKLVDAFLTQHKFEFIESQATFYVWLKAPPSYPSAEDYCQWLADETGIIATPGDALGTTTSQWLRLALVPTSQAIEECLKLWNQALSKT